jgi:hypothetical protein
MTYEDIIVQVAGRWRYVERLNRNSVNPGAGSNHMH